MTSPGFTMANGTLYLLPALLADSPPELVLPAGTLEKTRGIRHFIVEELRTARRFLIRAGIPVPIDELQFLLFNEHSRDADLSVYLAPAIAGNDIGLLSEAGVPCVADPGSRIVLAAHRAGIRVVPMTGPSSLLLALMASGFNGQQFAFRGYLPTDKNLRAKKIRDYERIMQQENQTQIFIETPYRNNHLLEALTAACQPSTLLCIASGLTGDNESVSTRSIAEWRRQRPDLQKTPAIFLIYTETGQ